MPPGQLLTRPSNCTVGSCNMPPSVAPIRACCGGNWWKLRPARRNEFGQRRCLIRFFITRVTRERLLSRHTVPVLLRANAAPCPVCSLLGVGQLVRSAAGSSTSLWKKGRRCFGVLTACTIRWQGARPWPALHSTGGAWARSVEVPGGLECVRGQGRCQRWPT